MDDEEIDQIADRLESRLKPEEKKEKETPADPFAGFGRAERNQLEALQYLSKSDPRFKGRDLSAETLTFWKKEQDYIKDWESAHKGEKFDAADTEHADFYRQNEPAGVSQDDLEDARVDMKVERRLSEVEKTVERKSEKKMEERFAPIERERVLKAASPAISRSIIGAVTGMAAQIVPDLVGDAQTLTPEIEAKIEAEDPVAMEFMQAEAELLKVRVHELESLRHLGPNFQFNKDRVVEVGEHKTRIKPHLDIIETAVEIEERMQEIPVEERKDETGRQFMSRVERMQRFKAIDNSALSAEEKNRRKQAIEERFWVVGPSHIREALVAKSVRDVRRQLAMAEKKVKHNESKKSKAAEKASEEKAVKQAAKPESKSAPSITAESDLVHSDVPGSKAQRSQAELNTQAFFG